MLVLYIVLVLLGMLAEFAAAAGVESRTNLVALGLALVMLMMFIYLVTLLLVGHPVLVR